MNEKDRVWLGQLKEGANVYVGTNMRWPAQVIKVTNNFISVKVEATDEIEKYRKSDGMKVGGIRYLQKMTTFKAEMK